MPLDRKSPLTTEYGVYNPFDLNVNTGEPVDKPGFGEVLAASARTENEVGSYLASEVWDMSSADYNRVDPQFNITPEMLDGYEEYQDKLLDTFNQDAFDAVRADIDREREDRALVDSAGFLGNVTDVVAGIASPTTVIPGGAFVRAGAAGFSVARSAVSVGLASGIGASLQEAGLQATRQTRTAEESALVVGGSVILGGAIGAAGAQIFSKSEWSKLTKGIEEDLVDTTPQASEISQEIVKRMQAAGADSVDDIDVSDLEIGGPRIAQAVANATAAVRINPGLTLLTSPSTRARATFLRLAENHVATSGEMEGRTLGPAAETLIRGYQGNLASFIVTRRENYRAARKAGFTGRMKEFDEAVAHAGRNNDVDPNGNEYVTKAAESWRRDVADPLKDEAVAVGLLPEDVKVTTAPSYLYRVYNRQKILSKEGEPQFREILRRHIRGEVKQAMLQQEEIGIARNINKAVDLEEQLNRAMGRLDSFEKRLEARRGQRDRRLESIRKKESERFDILRGRVPERVLDIAKQARDDDTMIQFVSQASKAPPKAAKRPVLNVLKELGGVRIGSPLDQELRAMGVTPQTAPGLFRRDGGRTAVDNIPASEHEIFARFQTDARGYAEPNEILAAIRDEMAGAPLRLDDELAEEAARDALVSNVEAWLDEIGLPRTATAKDVRQYLDQALKNESRLTGLDQAINRMTGELEEFDRVTDGILNEQTIAKADADRFADALNELEEKINQVRDQANASPRVKLIVDHADARKAHAKARYDQTRIQNRIDAIERVEADGRLTPEMEDELRALRSDKNAADEKAIRARDKMDRLKSMLPKDRGDALDFLSPEDMDSYVDDVVNAIFDRITGRTTADVPDWIVPTTQGPLKGRTLNIPDEQVEEFLENDMELIARKYIKQMGGEVELTRAFGRADMQDQLKAIREEYAELRGAAQNQKETDKLLKQEASDIANLEAFRDMARGTYRAGEEQSAWSAMTRLALSWNYIRLLGGVTLSSLPDAVNIMTRQGLRSFFSEGLPALTSQVKAAKIAKRDAKEWVGITETVLSTRMAEMAELNDPYAAGSVAERMMRNVTSTFSRLTFLDYWNDTLKTIVVLQSGNKISRLLKKGLVDVPDPFGTGAGKQVSFAKLDKGEISYLGRLGIDERMATLISDQIQKHGIEDNGITGLNLGKWTDKDARRTISAALSKEADGAVVTPGFADRPLWARSNPGKLAMQFKSFGLAAHQRILIARLQGRPKHLAEMMVFGTALGMMVSYLKFIERGDFEAAERLTENPGLWIADGFDRTGLAPLIMDVSNTAEKVGSPFGVRTAAQMLAGDEDRSADVSRYASRNVYGALFGPSAGMIGDIATIAAQAANLDFDKQGARAVLRQLPGATLPGARTVIQTQVRPLLEGATE